MKNNILIIVFAITLVLLFNTESNSQSIELPDFVITGVQSVSIPTMKKNKSDYIPVISEEFLKPKYEAEDFTLTEYSNPIKKQLELYDEPHGYNGLLKLGVGSQTLPTGDFYFNKGIGQFLFDTHIWGLNITEYIPNAGYNSSGGKVNFNYFINKRTLLFHGLAIGVDATFSREGYKLYGSISPKAERENNFTGFNLSLINRLQKTLNYGLGISGENINLTKDDVKEIKNDWNGFIRYDFGGIVMGIEALATSQEVVKNDGLVNKYNYFATNGFAEFGMSKLFYFKAGAHYSSQNNNSLFSPFVYFSFFMSNELTILASYTGDSDFFTNNYFITENRFYKAGLVDNVFQRNSSKLTGTIKYEYQNVIEINGGVAISRHNNYLYFEDNLVDGIFNINTINDVTRTAMFVNFNFDASHYGIFFANMELQNVKSADGNKITYTPYLITNFAYSYRFAFNLLGKIELRNFVGNYADLNNTIKLPSYFDLSLYVRYNLIENLALTGTINNLLNTNNYFYKNYREKPFDIIFGVEYNW